MKARGFTLLELLFVLVIVALLAGIVGPMVTGSVGRARESALKQDLAVLRKAIDDYYADRGRYPSELAELVERHYLRFLPADPLTESVDGWVVVRMENLRGPGGIVDVHTGSALQAGDGTAYRDW
ncbi:MAG TPA: prepilin-type N-terminal cleavage/methylation domain-containing protein [Gallionellaceae bacterium]